MKVLAVAMEGKEFLYRSKTAHRVSNRSWKPILSVLNSVRYKLKEGETWFAYDVSPYDTAYGYAEFQSFTIRSGQVFERT